MSFLWGAGGKRQIDRNPSGFSPPEINQKATPETLCYGPHKVGSYPCKQRPKGKTGLEEGRKTQYITGKFWPMLYQAVRNSW